jgi:hypothetical protein
MNLLPEKLAVGVVSRVLCSNYLPKVEFRHALPCSPFHGNHTDRNPSDRALGCGCGSGGTIRQEQGSRTNTRSRLRIWLLTSAISWCLRPSGKRIKPLCHRAVTAHAGRTPAADSFSKTIRLWLKARVLIRSDPKVFFVSFEYFAQQLSEPLFQCEWRAAFSCPFLPDDIRVDFDLQFRDGRRMGSHKQVLLGFQGWKSHGLCLEQSGKPQRVPAST